MDMCIRFVNKAIGITQIIVQIVGQRWTVPRNKGERFGAPDLYGTGRRRIKMAEFTEVMEQAKRMCDSFGRECSDECPLDSANPMNAGFYGDLCIAVAGGDVEKYGLIEERVMQWAAEHPEPVYPSWDDGWKQLFPGAVGTPCPRRYGKKYQSAMCAFTLCERCKKSPMHAEVAEKLGIKPIAPNKPVSEHNGCNGCKWFECKDDEEPCKRCRYCIDGDAPDLWEEG